jgi:beta-mannanase
MDTNKDGGVTIADDPYAPYYPGDSWVDFVGMSNFHFGNTYPWGKNEKAEPRKFAKKVAPCIRQ